MDPATRPSLVWEVGTPADPVMLEATAVPDLPTVADVSAGRLRATRRVDGDRHDLTRPLDRTSWPSSWCVWVGRTVVAWTSAGPPERASRSSCQASEEDEPRLSASSTTSTPFGNLPKPCAEIGQFVSRPFNSVVGSYSQRTGGRWVVAAMPLDPRDGRPALPGFVQHSIAHQASPGHWRAMLRVGSVELVPVTRGDRQVGSIESLQRRKVAIAQLIEPLAIEWTIWAAGFVARLW